MKWYLLLIWLAESLEVDDFQAKLDSLEGKWKTTVPGFHEWFPKASKSPFCRKGDTVSTRQF